MNPMADENDLGYEHELVQPVQSVSGVTLYNKVSRKPCGPALDSKTKQPLDYGSEALLIELDGAGNQVRMSARTDGVNCCHLLRQTLAPIVDRTCRVLRARTSHASAQNTSNSRP